MKRSFFIGIGGTGDWVLTFLKAKLQATHGKLPDEIRMRLLDTVSSADREAAFESEERTYQRMTIGSGIHKEKVADVGSARIYGNEYVPLVKTGTGDFFNRAEEIEDGNHEHLQWFRAAYYLAAVPRAQFSLTDGAGQWRQFGRMALFFFSSGHGSEVLNAINTNLEELRRDARDERITVYVIASLVGGTGAGAFLDVANLVRYCSNSAGIGIQLIGMFVLPGAFNLVLGDKTLNRARAYAAFRELQRFQSSFGTPEPFSVQYGRNLHVDLKEKLFDAVYLLDAERDSNSLDMVRPEEGLFPSIADGIELFLDTASGQQLFQKTCNITAEHAGTVRTGTTVPAIYSSFGTWKLILPARLYALKFAYKIAERYIEELVQPVLSHGTVSALRDNIRHGEERPVDHRKEAIDILGKTHASLKSFVERLTGSTGFDQLDGFVRNLERKRIVSQYLAVKDPDISRLVQTEGAKLIRDVFDGVQDGGETGLQSQDANRQIRNRCEGLWDSYFREGGEYDQALETVLGHVQEEINSALDVRLTEMLKGGVSYREKLGTLGYSRKVLGYMITILQDIEGQLFKGIRLEIDRQFGELQDAEQKVRQARADMEGKVGYDGGIFSKRPKREAHRAQREYIEAMDGWIKREQQERLLEALDKIIDHTTSRVKQWSDEINSWAGHLCEGVSRDGKRSPGSFQECVNQIHRVNDELRRIGKSYTSSIGMAVWSPNQDDADLDTGMGGWEEALFAEAEKVTGELLLRRQWLDNTAWDVNYEDVPGKRPVFGLSVKVKLQDGTQRELSLTRETVHRVLYEQAFEHVLGFIQDKSILDYLATRHNTTEIAQLLMEKTAPMLKAGTDDRIKGAYLIYRNKPEHAAFMDQLLQELKTNAAIGTNLDRFDVYEDPYTLTFAIMQDRIEEKDIAQVVSYAATYWDEMNSFSDEALPHRQYHVFRCEEQAVGIEREYYKGIGDFQGARPLSALVYRLLEYPKLVETFIDAHVFGLISKGTYARDGIEVWCLCYQPQADPKTGFDVTGVAESRIPGVVLAWNKDGRSSSLLDAMSGFVLRRKCIKRPADAIDQARTEEAIGNKRVCIQQKGGDFNRNMMERYENQRSQLQNDRWWETHQPVGGDWEKQGLRILYKHYLNSRINHWRRLMS